MSSKKPKRILPNGLENGAKIYRRPKDFRSNIKTKVEINIDDLRKMYIKHYIPLLKKESYTDDVIREKFKEQFMYFFVQCGYEEKMIIPQLIEWEKEISFNQDIKDKGTNLDERT